MGKRKIFIGATITGADSFLSPFSMCASSMGAIAALYAAFNGGGGEAFKFTIPCAFMAVMLIMTDNIDFFIANATLDFSAAFISFGGTILKIKNDKMISKFEGKIYNQFLEIQKDGQSLVSKIKEYARSLPNEGGLKFENQIIKFLKLRNDAEKFFLDKNVASSTTSSSS